MAAAKSASAAALWSQTTRKRGMVADLDRSRSSWASGPKALAVSRSNGSVTGSQRAVTPASCKDLLDAHACRAVGRAHHGRLVRRGARVEGPAPPLLAAGSATRAEDDAELEHAVARPTVRPGPHSPRRDMAGRPRVH